MFAYMYGIVLKGSFTNVHFNKHIQSYKHQAICGMDWQVPAQKWTWISDEEKLLQFYLRVTSQGAKTKKTIVKEGKFSQVLKQGFCFGLADGKKTVAIVLSRHTSRSPNHENDSGLGGFEWVKI